MSKTQQQEADSREYDVWESAFSCDSKVPAQILIGAIDDKESALKAHRKAHRYDASKEHKETIAEKLAEYR